MANWIAGAIKHPGAMTRKAKKEGGIGTHVTAMTKRRFFPNLQRVKALVKGSVRNIMVCTACMKANRVIRPPVRTWKPEAKAAA